MLSLSILTEKGGEFCKNSPHIPHLTKSLYGSQIQNLRCFKQKSREKAKTIIIFQLCNLDRNKREKKRPARLVCRAGKGKTGG